MAVSTVRQIPERLTFVPHTTMGGNGYAPSLEARLAERIEHLDALLTLVTNEIEDEGGGFQNLNNTIQAAVLRLASSLASEVNELHKEIETADVNAQNGF